MRRRLAGLLLAAGLLAAPWVAQSHEVRPALLQLSELEADRFAMLWRVPARGDRALALEPVLPAHCRTVGPPAQHRDGTRFETRSEVQCTDGLAGSAITIDDLSRLKTDVLVRVDYANGGTETLRATPSEPTVVLAGRRDLVQVSGTYFWLGIEHILYGIDHLLFVAALVLLVSGWRRLLATITAFTLAHSLTLVGATLGLVSAPIALVEALIALSIVVIAAEIVRQNRGISGVGADKPWIVAFAFGLLHGFGFAGALNEVGLPSEAIPAALLFFNLGVEAGQVLFVAAIILPVHALRLAKATSWNWLRTAATYSIGTVAAFWTVERVAGIWL